MRNTIDQYIVEVKLILTAEEFKQLMTIQKSEDTNEVIAVRIEKYKTRGK